MGKTYTVKITDFSGGMSEDKRVQSPNKFSLTKHFDALTFPHKLVPYPQVAEAGSSVDALGIVKFLYAPYASSFALYGFGQVSGDTKPKIYYQTVSDIATNIWTLATNGTSGVSARNTEVFFYYKGFIYMFCNNAKLVRFDITQVAAFNDNYQSISYTNVALPVHHPSDDIAYFFVDNLVYALNGTSWNGIVLTLPTNLKIVSCCPYGNYLAIGCQTLNDAANIQSLVYLWDRDSSLTTISERIDLGEGKLLKLSNLNNQLIAIMNVYTDNVNLLPQLGKYYIKKVSGNSFVILNTLLSDTTASAQSGYFERNNKLYISLSANDKGDSRMGIWVIDENGRMTLDFYDSIATIYNGIYLVGNVWYISHSNGTKISHTDNNGTLAYSSSIPSIYESLIFNGGDSTETKKLVGVSVMTEPLHSAGTITLKYRKPTNAIDQTTLWTTIFANSTADSISHDAINIESSGADLPQFDEIQFRIESLGGAVITGLRFTYEIIDSGLYP